MIPPTHSTSLPPSFPPPLPSLHHSACVRLRARERDSWGLSVEEALRRWYWKDDCCTASLTRPFLLHFAHAAAREHKKKKESATRLKSFHFWLISAALILESVPPHSPRHPPKHIKLPVGWFAVWMLLYLSHLSPRPLLFPPSALHRAVP